MNPGRGDDPSPPDPGPLAKGGAVSRGRLALMGWLRRLAAGLPGAAGARWRQAVRRRRSLSPEGTQPLPPSQTLAQLLRRAHWPKVLLFIASLYLFVLAIGFLKSGAQGLGHALAAGLDKPSLSQSLGGGWLAAYLILSGSPVAAVALTLLSTELVDPTGALGIIIGSRLGANLLVLGLGFLYVLRGRDRETSLSMGLLSLTVTFVTHVFGLLLGLAMLRRRVFASLTDIELPALTAFFDVMVNPLLDLTGALLPGWAMFGMGLAMTLVSFNLFDRCLPQMTLRSSQLGRTSRLVYRPWVMFLLGSALTMISMSVSVSLSILVPLSDRGFVRRENVIPYIMGANVTTYTDTLFAAILLSSPAAVGVVLVLMASIALVSLAILTLAYRPFEHAALGFASWVTAKNGNVVAFMVLIIAAPLLLILLG